MEREKLKTQIQEQNRLALTELQGFAKGHDQAIQYVLSLLNKAETETVDSGKTVNVNE